ncbi:hypothetical protein IQ235_18110 [Oscillatoriales cyanobacterium LEGE 11467]|uniref:Uncharacterized protein n=1 Tax=Zarconia navalis LEGE 11467 TaxID=1828826 RepID=A0A928W0K1_9CYAN|nr:hypothetical protein [Zarconia navalis LEGE 11467]
MQVFHRPQRFSRRAGELSANIYGTLSAKVDRARYQLNGGIWHDVGRGGKRAPEPLFVIEMKEDALRAGTNTLNIEAQANRGQPEVMSLQFEYDPQPIVLPVKTDWSKGDLEVQDGYWETFSADGQWRVRPKPGFEDYDRILCVTGAFAGGRRIETELIFRSSDFPKRCGFGVLPLWGGHKDPEDFSPRRGWIYSIAWFHPYRQGGGVEFGYKNGDEPRKWVDSYRQFEPEPNVRYFLTAECWPEKDEAGGHLGYRQRMKWHKEGEADSNTWIELRDTEGCPLPEGEYAVALIAHFCQVDFGKTVVGAIAQPPLDTISSA